MHKSDKQIFDQINKYTIYCDIKYNIKIIIYILCCAFAQKWYFRQKLTRFDWQNNNTGSDKNRLC